MKTRVLVVDDDRLVADTLSMIYNANGYEAEARYSAADGFARARDFSPALMICDVTMPEESGLDLAERMLDVLPNMQMLMLTAYASNAAEVTAHSRRLRRPLKLLNKPCRPDDLLRESKAMLTA